MTDAELAALEQRMIAAAPIVLEATAEASDDAELPDGVRKNLAEIGFRKTNKTDTFWAATGSTTCFAAARSLRTATSLYR